MDAFESRLPVERRECLRWVAAARGYRDEEDRVSRLLDDLAFGNPLPR